MTTTNEMAWCAGVIDTLGLIKIRELDNGTNIPSVSISTPHVELAKRMGELTGVGIVTVKRNYNRTPCTDHCTEAHSHVVSTTARWELTGARARVFLDNITPYLVTKQFDVIRVLEETKDAPFKPATIQKMTSLGWSHG